MSYLSLVLAFMEKLGIIKILQFIYLGIFILSIALTTLMHLVPAPALAMFRIPTNLREIGPHVGLVWPTSLEIYHIFLLLFFIVLILNGIGLYRLHIAKWRSVCRISSFFGLFLIWSIFIFFMMPLILQSNLQTKNLQTSFIYSLFAFAFFIVDLLTFAVVEKKWK